MKALRVMRAKAVLEGRQEPCSKAAHGRHRQIKMLGEGDAAKDIRT